MKISNITIYVLIGLGLLMIIISALSPGLVGVSPVENFAATRIPRCMGGMIEVQGENGGVRCCDTADCRNTTRSCVLTGTGANCDAYQSEILSRANCPRGQEGVLDEDGSMKCQSKTANQQCHSSGPNEGGAVPCADISAADCPSGYVPARREVAGFQNVLVCERSCESGADQCVATTQDIERIRAERPEVILPGPQAGREGRNCLVLREQPPPTAGMMPMQNEFEIVDEKLATPMKLRYHQNKRSGDFCIFRNDRDKLDRLLSSRVICKAYQDMYMRKLCPEVDA